MIEQKMKAVQLLDLMNFTNELEIYEYIYIYGAGVVGSFICNYLLDHSQRKKIKGFLVSDRGEKSLLGFSIRRIDEVIISKNDIVILAATKNYRKEMLDNCVRLGVRNIKEIDVLDHNDYLWPIETKIKEPLKDLNFVYSLSEHCNLNCAGCDHFSPIADKEFSDVEEFGRDIKRLSAIFSGKCRRIALMGGEPLLCPDINKYLIKSREYFKDSQICIVTNGLLLGKMRSDFFSSCLKNNIEIEYTKYPVKYDYDLIHKMIEKKGITIRAYGNTNDYQKDLYFIPLDLDGKQNIEWNFSHCVHANNCIQLKHGRLYTCTIIPNINHFNKRFHKDLKVVQEDSIDIYDASITQKKILDFLSKPVPFCKYCDVKNRTYGHEWRISSGNMKEWTV